MTDHSAAKELMDAIFKAMPDTPALRLAGELVEQSEAIRDRCKAIVELPPSKDKEKQLILAMQNLEATATYCTEMAQALIPALLAAKLEEKKNATDS